MANPQLKNGYTKISNELLSATARFPFNGSQLRIILFLWRATSGLKKEEGKISISQWVKGTKLNKRTVYRELKKLEKMNVLNVSRFKKRQG